MTRSALLAQVDLLNERAADRALAFGRSVAAGLLATAASAGACHAWYPGDTVGYVHPPAVALAAGWAVGSTWRQWRAARRRAVRKGGAIRGFAGQRFTWLCLHGRGTPAAGPGKEARVGHRTEDDRRRRDGVVAAAA